jgi:hypothetical protein
MTTVTKVMITATLTSRWCHSRGVTFTA